MVGEDVATPVYEYFTRFGHPSTVHLVDQGPHTVEALMKAHTLCGTVPAVGAKNDLGEWGHETVSGSQATCLRCIDIKNRRAKKLASHASVDYDDEARNEDLYEAIDTELAQMDEEASR